MQASQAAVAKAEEELKFFEEQVLKKSAAFAEAEAQMQASQAALATNETKKRKLDECIAGTVEPADKSAALEPADKSAALEPADKSAALEPADKSAALEPADKSGIIEIESTKSDDLERDEILANGGCIATGVNFDDEWQCSVIEKYEKECLESA